ncbi:hypothetical protein PM082_024452 [Marasmius tenuissimus]|nr:hypothetical protein PM082_024452 [Marasmius tenuissimus]
MVVHEETQAEDLCFDVNHEFLGVTAFGFHEKMISWDHTSSIHERFKLRSP